MSGYKPETEPSLDTEKAYSICSLATDDVYITGYAVRLSKFLDNEYPILKGVTYLDHGGTTQYAKSLIDDFSKDMNSHLYGNPHSASDPSTLSSRVVNDVRQQALMFFGANPEHFDLVFTANATAAIKLVGDTMRDAQMSFAEKNVKQTGQKYGCPDFWYGYHTNCHTSLVGIRETIDGDHHCFKSSNEVQLWLDSPDAQPETGAYGLFAYPGQSNMTGQRLPISWCHSIRRRPGSRKIYSLFDAAALATTSSLNYVFSNPDDAPDFTVLSFYKIFGFPDLGALIINKASSDIFEKRRYFGGGTVDMVINFEKPWHALHEGSLHSRLEDGTLPFHSIIALGHAMRTHERLYGPSCMENISKHVLALRLKLYTAMRSLAHGNGMFVCSIYGDETIDYMDSRMQGPTIAFNLKRSDGTYWAYTEVEKLANTHGIFLRSGGLCNPGGIATYLNLGPDCLREAYAAGHRCGGGVGTDIFEGKQTGVVRISLGAMSTADDVNKFLEFLSKVFVERC